MDIYNGLIDIHTDWGNADGNGTPLTGELVQKFIKDEFGSKFGYARIPYEPDENSYLTLELFANKESADIYDEAEDKEAEEIKQLITEVVIPIPTVEGDSFTSALSTTIKNNDIVVTDNNFEVEFNFRAIRHTKGSPLNEGALGTLIIQRSTDSGETWNEVGTIKNVLRSNEPNDTTTVQKVNIGLYLAQGRQMVRVRASFDYEDQQSGDTKTAVSTWVAIGTSISPLEVHTASTATDAVTLVGLLHHFKPKGEQVSPYNL